jgi:hypothetical protein
MAGIALNGAAAGNSSYYVTDNNTLMIWGGDARSGQGETVFFKAPLISPADPRNDDQNLPRFVTLDAYCAWWSGTIGMPAKLSIYTYQGGIMLKPTSDNTTKPSNQQTPWINNMNFYNVPEGTTEADLLSADAWDYLIPPVFSTSKDLVIDKSAPSHTRTFRTDYVRLATITYDRYKRSATVTWHATEYIGGIIIPFGLTTVDGGPKP